MQTPSIHSAGRAVCPPTRRHRRHAPAALLPLQPHRHRCLVYWGALLGHLEAYAAVRVRVPPRAEEGGSRGRDGRHTGEQPARYFDIDNLFGFFAVLQRKCRMTKQRRDGLLEEPTKSPYFQYEVDAFIVSLLRF